MHALRKIITESHSVLSVFRLEISENDENWEWSELNLIQLFFFQPLSPVAFNYLQYIVGNFLNSRYIFKA